MAGCGKPDSLSQKCEKQRRREALCLAPCSNGQRSDDSDRQNGEIYETKGTMQKPGGIRSSNRVPDRVPTRIFPTAQPFRAYIDDVNETNKHGQQITLDLTDRDVANPVHAAYSRLLDRLVVAVRAPQSPQLVSTFASSLHLSHTLSLEQILTSVITNALRRDSPFIASQKNVLCAGFSLANQDGPGSALRNLDARSPSAPVQNILTPAFRLLLLRVGHVLLTHLLTDAVLLQAVPEARTRGASRAPGRTKHCRSQLSFVQLCGPVCNDPPLAATLLPRRSDHNIVMRQDVLYQRPKTRRNLAKQVTAVSALSTSVYNRGLPKAHHLHAMSGSTFSATLLALLIFANKLPGSRYDTPTFNASTSEHIQANGVASSTLPPREFDEVASKLYTACRGNMRGKKWLSIKKLLPRRLSRVTALLEDTLGRVRKHCFRRTLGRTCPLSPLVRGRGAAHGFRRLATNRPSVQTLIGMSTEPKSVALFLITCCRQMLPSELFGSQRNCNAVEQAVHHFVRSRLQRENFNIHRYFAAKSLCVTDVGWLHTTNDGTHGKRVQNPTDLSFRHEKLMRLLIWMFRGVLLPLLAQNFYVTEGNLHKNKVFFFRREVWTLLVDSANDVALRSSGQFLILSREQLAQRERQRDALLSRLGPLLSPNPIMMFHYVRYVPKKSSLRCIQRPYGKLLSCAVPGLSKGYNDARVRKPLSRNSLCMGQRRMKSWMNNLLAVLGAESRAQEAFLGASVFSLDSIYAKWLELVLRWKQRGKPKMYAFGVDIAKSFDTIPLKTLMEDVVPRLLTRARYPIVKARLTKRDVCSERAISRIITVVCLQGGIETSFVRLVREMLGKRHPGAVFSDVAHMTTLNRFEILATVEEFIANNVVAVPRRSRRRSETGFAVQMQGVPQGHPLSPLLTSLFYGYVERKEFGDIMDADVACGRKFTTEVEKAEEECGMEVEMRTQNTAVDKVAQRKRTSDSRKPISLLMRLVDDTMFLSSEKPQATRLLHRMLQGWKTTHGFSLNGEKTRASFHADVGGTEGMREMPWCGLLIDMETLEVRLDYRKYAMHGFRVRECITVEQDAYTGRFLHERTMQCFKPKLHPILLDQRINGARTVQINIYQAAVLCGLKFCAYINAMPRVGNGRYVAEVAEGVVNRYVTLAQRAGRKKVWEAKERGASRMTVSNGDVRFLAVHAFRTAMLKKLMGRSKSKEGVRQAVDRCIEALDCMAEKCLSDREANGLGRAALVAEKFARDECDALWRLAL